MCNRTTIQPTVQGATFSMCGRLYHWHHLIISPLHGHGEVANENPLILPCTLSLIGALVLLERRGGKKNASSAFRLKSLSIHDGVLHRRPQMVSDS